MPLMDSAMRWLKVVFWISLVVWLVGGLVTVQYGSEVKQLQMLMSMSEQDAMMLNLRGISLNLFGPIAILSGIILGVLLIVKKLTKVGLGGSGSEGPEDVATLPRGQVAATASTLAENKVAATSERGGLRCDFSGWIVDGNRIVQEYTYSGQGMEIRLVAEFTVERGSVGMLRFLNFWLNPANGYEGPGEAKVSNVETDQSPGWVAIRMATAHGGMTLVNVPSRADENSIWQLLNSDGDLDLSIRVDGDLLLELPLPHSDGLHAQYEKVVETLR